MTKAKVPVAASAVLAAAALLACPAACRRHPRLSPETMTPQPEVLDVCPTSAPAWRSAPPPASPPALGNLFDRVEWALDVVSVAGSPPSRRAEAGAVLASVTRALATFAVAPTEGVDGWCGTNNVLRAEALVNARDLLATIVREATAGAAYLDRPDVGDGNRRDAVTTLRADLAEVRKLHEQFAASEWGRAVLDRPMVPAAGTPSAPTNVPARRPSGAAG